MAHDLRKAPLAASDGEPGDAQFGFLVTQFNFHVEKINRLHEERSSLMKYAVFATFTYYAWLMNTPKVADGPLDNRILHAAAWFAPLGLNTFGLWRNSFLMKTVRKHGGFLDHLLREGMGVRNHFREYLQSRGDAPARLHPTMAFWWAMIALSAVTGGVGAFVENAPLVGRLE